MIFAPILLWRGNRVGNSFKMVDSRKRRWSIILPYLLTLYNKIFFSLYVYSSFRTCIKSRQKGFSCPNKELKRKCTHLLSSHGSAEILQNVVEEIYCHLNNLNVINQPTLDDFARGYLWHHEFGFVATAGMR